MRGVVFGGSGLMRGLDISGSGLMRGVVFGGSGLMRWLDVSGSGLMRGVDFGGSGLIKGGLLYDINPVSSF